MAWVHGCQGTERDAGPALVINRHRYVTAQTGCNRRQAQQAHNRYIADRQMHTSLARSS
jgi:hypothetical protein